MMGKNITDIIREVLREGYQNPLNSEGSGDLTKIESLKDDIVNRLTIVYKEITNKVLELPKIIVKIDDSIKDGKIAGFNYPNNETSAGELGVKSKALKNMDYLRDIITHELIHAAIGEDQPDHVEHSGLFDKLAKGMGLPVERRD